MNPLNSVFFAILWTKIKSTTTQNLLDAAGPHFPSLSLFMACSICRQPGHNKTTCKNKPSQENKPKKTIRKCTVCRQEGHTRRTCLRDPDGDFHLNRVVKVEREYNTRARSKQKEAHEEMGPSRKKGPMPVTQFERSVMTYNCGKGKMSLTAEHVCEIIISKALEYIALVEVPNVTFCRDLCRLLNQRSETGYCADYDQWKDDKFLFLWRKDVCTLAEGMSPIRSDENKYCVYFCEDVAYGTIAFFVVHLPWRNSNSSARVSCLVNAITRVLRSHPSFRRRLCVLGDFNEPVSGYAKELEKYSLHPLLDAQMETTPKHSCIDNILVPVSWALVAQAQVLTECLHSDHFPVVA